MLNYIIKLRISELHIALDKYNYRIMSEDEYDEDAEKIQELKESISEVGLINPITVRPTNEGHYEVVAGHRRFIACKALGFTEIPCIVIDPDSDSKSYVIGLVENLQRNNMKPLEEAIGIKKYSEMFNVKSNIELAKRVGKDPKFIRSRLIMLKLPKPVQDAINNKDISIKIAERISKNIHSNAFRSDLFIYLITKKLTSLESEKLVQLAEDYEKTYRIQNKLTETQLEPIMLRLANLLKDHDIQFVEGYLRLKPSTFDERGEYSKTTRTIKKFFQATQPNQHSKKKDLFFIHRVLSYMNGKKYHMITDLIQDVSTFKTKSVIRLIEKKQFVIKDEDNKYIITPNGRTLLHCMDTIKELMN